MALTVAPIFAEQARAQGAGLSAEDRYSTSGDDEIIVTARKRNESILKVPVIATAITQEQLGNYAVADINSIATRVTGIQLGEGAGNNGTQVSLRGIGAGVVNPGVEQSVSLNIDGVQMTSGNAFKMGMFDLQQIEVLKGPQSLFFGKNSPGGVISMRSADPTNEVEVIGRVGYEFEAKEKRVELILSGPVSDVLGLRLAASYLDSAGYFKDRTMGDFARGALTPDRDRFAPNEEWMVRGTAVFKPSELFNARLKINYSHSRLEGNSNQFVSCPDGTASLVGLNFIGGGEDCKADRVVRSVNMRPDVYLNIKNGGNAVTEYDQGFGSLEMNYKVANDITLSSLTGYYIIDQLAVQNGLSTTEVGPVIGVDGDFDREDFTQEIRLTSDFRDSPINFMIGAFYQDGKVKHVFDLPYNRTLPFPFPAVLSAASHRVDIRSVSAFGQLLWKVVPQVEIAAGARWTDEKRKHTVFNLISGSPVAIALADPKISSSNLSPEVTITYTPTNDLTLFAAYKQGFKSGSFDVTGTPAAGAKTSFNDEKVKGVEAGLKSRLLDRTLNLNIGGYYYRYSDLQVGANETNAEKLSFGVRTLNAASAKVYGVDFDLTYRPPAFDGFVVDASVNWNKSRYKKFDNAPCWGGQMVSEGCNLFPNPTTGLRSGQDLSGRELLRAPKWTATAGFDYDAPLTDGLKLGFGMSARYSSSYYTNFLLRDDMVQDGYVKINARLAIADVNDKWELALIGNNLNDERICGASSNGNFQNGAFFGGVTTGGTTRGPAGIDELICRMERGREVHLRLSVHL